MSWNARFITGSIPGCLLSGNLYCYRNPLASNGEKLRNPWYDTDCCPPNIERLFESLPGYFYAMSRDGVYVNLYHNSELDWQLEDGIGIKIAQATKLSLERRSEARDGSGALRFLYGVSAMACRRPQRRYR